MGEERTDPRIARRQMLKRIGAGAAIAWSAPVLSSMRVPAFGQTSPDPQGCLDGQNSCDGADFNCRGLARCFCTTTTEGGTRCGCFDRGGCEGYQACTTTAQCPAGEFCAPGPDCCGGICLPPCSDTCGGGQPASQTVLTPGVPPTR